MSDDTPQVIGDPSRIDDEKEELKLTYPESHSPTMVVTVKAWEHKQQQVQELNAMIEALQIKVEREQANADHYHQRGKELAAEVALYMSMLVDYQKPDENVYDCILRLLSELGHKP